MDEMILRGQVILKLRFWFLFPFNESVEYPDGFKNMCYIKLIFHIRPRIFTILKSAKRANRMRWKYLNDVNAIFYKD